MWTGRTPSRSIGSNAASSLPIINQRWRLIISIPQQDYNGYMCICREVGWRGNPSTRSIHIKHRMKVLVILTAPIPLTTLMRIMMVVVRLKRPKRLAFGDIHIEYANNSKIFTIHTDLEKYWRFYKLKKFVETKNFPSKNCINKFNQKSLSNYLKILSIFLFKGFWRNFLIQCFYRNSFFHGFFQLSISPTFLYFSLITYFVSSLSLPG